MRLPPAFKRERVGNRGRQSRWLPAIALTALGLSANAAGPLGFQTKFQTRTDLVYIDVSVLDRDRRPVHGLTAEDFTILEDGKVRPLAAFVPVRLPESSARERRLISDVVTNDLPREGRLVVVVFDWTIRGEDQPLARRIATSIVENLGPADMAAVTFTSQFADAGSSQDFTTDSALLLKAITAPFATAPHANPTTPGNRNGAMIDDLEGHESGHCFCGLCSLDTITRIAEALQNTPERRKEVFFIGTYFPGLEAPNPRPAGGIGFAGLGGDPGRSNSVACQTPFKEARDKLVRAVGLANVIVHVLDPLGIETDANSPGGGTRPRMVQRHANLPTLAKLTGGRVVMNTNAPDEHLPAIFSESQSYYVMGFTPASSGPGRQRRIEVKVRGKGLQVRSRNAYVQDAPMPSTSRDTMAGGSTLARELRPILPTGDLPLSLRLIPIANVAQTQSGVGVLVGTAESGAQPMGLKSGPDGFTVLAAAFDQRARVVAVADKGTVLSDDKKPDEVLALLPLRPGAYQIRVAMEAAGKRGSVYSHVDVPDASLEPLSLSGPVVSLGRAMPIGSLPADLQNALPLTPTLRREFTTADKVQTWVRIHQGQRERITAVQVSTAILSVAGEKIFADQTILDVEWFAKNRFADYQIELPSGREPGEYSLELECSAGRERLVRRLTFSIQQP